MKPNRNLFAVEPEVYDSQFRNSDDYSYEETLQADEPTLRARGFTSDFCGAWLGFWAEINREFGVALEAESERIRARKGKPSETAEQILCKARGAYMAVMSAAVIADKGKSRIRSFRVGAASLEATRRGEYYDYDAMSDEEAKRIRANLSRYWREAYSYIHLVQRVTRLPFVERDAREFKTNERAYEAARYTDRITDIVGSVIAEKNATRGKRALRLNHAVSLVLDNFRRECEHTCRDPRICRRPHALTSIQRPPVTEEDNANQPATEEKKSRAKVISFAKAKEKILAGVEIARARFNAGALTPKQAAELVTMLAPVVEMEIATSARSVSSVGSGVPDADSATETPDEHTFTEPEFTSRTQNEKCDFAGENEQFQPPPADNFIRMEACSPEAPEATLDDFLSVFFPDPYEEINLRAFAPKGAPNEVRFAAKTWRTCREALTCDANLLAELHESNRTRGIYFVVNSGGNKAGDITRINAFFAEMDEGTHTEQHSIFDASLLPPTLRNETLKSVHGFYPAAPGVSLETFDEIQRRLIHHFKSDPKIKDRSRVMRLPGFDHVSYNNGFLSYRPVSLARFNPEHRFTAEEMLAAFPAAPEQKSRTEYARKTIDALTGGFEGWKRELGQRVAAHRSARRNGGGKVDCQGVCHNGKGSTGLFYDPTQNFIWCNSSCDLNTIAAAFGMSAYLEGSAA